MLRFRVLASLIALAIVAGMPVSAATDASLRAVRGTVGYQATKDSPFARIFGSYLVQDDQFAVTQAKSNALLVLQDSSEVALGENTTIQVGQITQASTAAPTAITLVAGKVRFSVKHPVGAESNYRFVTNTSQIAVRGTIGLYSTGPNGDVISCIECSAGDVTVTAAGKTLALLTGQTATISIAGIVTVAATTAAVAGGFSGAGLSTAATTSSFAPGIGAAAAGAAGASTAAVAAAAVGAAAVGVAVASTVKTPAPSPSATVSPTPTPSPSPSPVQGGSATISGKTKAPSVANTPAASAAPLRTTPPIENRPPELPPPPLGGRH